MVKSSSRKDNISQYIYIIKKYYMYMDEKIKKNIRNYDLTVETYYDNTRKIENPEIKIRTDFLSCIKDKGRILDLACGPGRDAKIFSERGYNVLGVDLSKGMIEKARKVAPRATFKLGDFTNLVLKNSSFDAVWFNAGLLSVEKKYAKKFYLTLIRP